MSLLAPLARPPAQRTTSNAFHFMTTGRRLLRHCKHSTQFQSGLRQDGSRVAVDIRQVENGDLENVFISSLVAAGTCREHRRRNNSGVRENWKRWYYSGERNVAYPKKQLARSFHSRARQNQAGAAAVALRDEDVSRAEYIELVNTYPRFQPDDLTIEEKKAKWAEHLPLAPRLVMTAEQEERLSPGTRQILEPEDAMHHLQITQFSVMLRKELATVPYSKLWQAYEALPKPRPRYLTDAKLRRFFRHLAWVEFKASPDAMQHYFAVLNECLGEGAKLDATIWNTAIAFAGRWMKTVSKDEVKGAIETWMRMEQGGHRATGVTFHILFDVAVKAGRFALADTILNEMKERNIAFNRHFRTSLIYYAGMRGDGDAVRQAFRDLVNAGEIVDTGVMNCVILSLLKADEAAGAEHVFQRMKALHQRKFSMQSPRSWRERKALGNILDQTARSLRKQREEHEASFFGGSFASDDRREKIQRATPIAPNARTYRMLIQYHASVSGDIATVGKLMDEMLAAGFPPHGSLYVHILRGFYHYGGYTSSRWNHKALEGVWSDFITAFQQSTQRSGKIALEPANNETLPGAVLADTEDEGAESVSRDSPGSVDDLAGPVVTSNGLDDEQQSDMADQPAVFNKAVAFSAIRGFYRCAGRKRTLEVWDEIQDCWNGMTKREREEIQETVDHLLKDDRVYIR